MPGVCWGSLTFSWQLLLVIFSGNGELRFFSLNLWMATFFLGLPPGGGLCSLDVGCVID